MATIRNPASFLPLLLLVVSHVCGQSSIDRSKTGAIVSMVSGSGFGSLTVGSRRGASGNACLRWTMTSFMGPVVEYELPFQDVGAAIPIGSDQVLVCGRTVTAGTTNGYICRLQMDTAAESVTLQETVHYPGMDVFRIAWNEPLLALAVIDLESRILYCAPFLGPAAAPTTPVLPAPGMLELAAVPAALPALNGDDIRLFATAANGFHVRADSLAPSYLVWPHGGGGWGIQFCPPTAGAAWTVSDERGHQGPLYVVSTNPTVPPEGTAFTVVSDTTGSSVASGTQTTPNAWVAVAPPQDFFDHPGAPFRVTGPGSSDSEVFRPLVRYGVPISSGSYSAGRGTVESEFVYIGSPRFTLGSPLTISTIGPENTTPQPVAAFLWLNFGFRGAGAPPDPVTVHDGVALLMPAASIYFAHTQLFSRSGCATSLAVPGDPDMEGSILLAQWVFVSPANPEQIAVTDVFGTRIWGPPASAAMGGTSGRAVPLARQREACRRWSTRPELLLTPEKQREVERIVRVFRGGH